MMSTQQYKKICWNCDGEILIHQKQCPYCGISLNAKPQELNLEDSLASLYKPPYLLKRTEPPKWDEEKKVIYSYEKDTQPTKVEKGNRDLWALFLLSIGGHLLALGLLIFFFSDHGFLILKWKSRFWFLYCLASFPLLSLGLKALKRVR